MRGILISLALLGLASPLSAGVYNTTEPLPEIPLEKVRSVILQLRAVAVPPAGPQDPGSLRATYQRQALALEKEKANGTLSMVDRANLGACYIRLGRARDAIRVLSEGDKDLFLIQANLASAYDLQGDLEVAVRHQERLLDLWPDVWATWKRNQLDWSRECEKVYLRLLRSRIAEKRRPTAGPLDVDPIFPGLRLIGPGENGEYEAGQLARAVTDRLPPEAGRVTLQLAVWYPQDLRLYWLLGELLNANGAVVEASEIVDELVQNGHGGDFKDLMLHRKVLDAGAKVQKKLREPDNWTLILSLFSAVPHGALEPIGVGAIAQQVAAAMPVALVPIIKNPPFPSDAGPVGVSPTAAPQLPFNWRHVTVGFAFGFLVAALIGFQWQEWRRRRGLPALDGEEVADPASNGASAEQEHPSNIPSGGPSSVRPREW